MRKTNSKVEHLLRPKPVTQPPTSLLAFIDSKPARWMHRVGYWLVCGLPKHGLYTSQSDSDVIIASFIVGVVNSVAFENCLQVQSYTCAVCSVLITYMGLRLEHAWICALYKFCNNNKNNGLFPWGVNFLRSCKVAYLLMVINAVVSAANSTPASPSLSPASTQLLLTSLTALRACSMVFVVAGARNNARSVLPVTPPVTLPLSAAPLMWLVGVAGVGGVDGAK